MSEDLSGKKIPFSSPSDWDLIKIIAQFLSKDPRLSIKELVDNALDAFSRIPYSPSEGKLVKLIIRKKDKVSPHIKIADNGPGWDPHKDSSNPNYGRPDFEYTVQNIGESIKKKFAEFNKAREEGSAVGRYGIGMFSFWAVGERLTAYSRSVLEEGKVGPCSMMVWLKDDKEAIIKHDVDPPSELSKKVGSVLVLDQLTKAQMNLVTGNILADYLSRASRTLLMKSGADLIIDDHGKIIPVIPKKYVGTKFPIIKCETKGFGSINLEIYAFPHVQSDEEFRVPLFVKAAKAYDDITELPELNKYPWNAKKVYGEINYPFGTLSPSRTGLVNDPFLGAFIETMQEVTTQLAEFVDRLEAKKKAKQRDKFYTIFREKWEEIFKQLPEEWLKKDEEIKRSPPPPPPPPPTGPMYRVEISPNEPKVSLRTAQSLTARPFDINGNILRDAGSSLMYSWESIGKPLGIIKDDMSKTCHFQVGGKEGIATIKVTVLQYVEGKEEPIMKTAATNIFVVPVLPPRTPPSPPKGDKPPTPLEDNLGEDGPHSKYDPVTKIVTINDHHKDWIKAEQKDIETLYRYFNYCFAKEVAVDRWKFLDPQELSEKIMDLVALSERSFNWKELVKRRRGRYPKEKETTLSNAP